MSIGMKNILQGGLVQNYSEAPVEQLTKEYSMYLIPDEIITIGFKLVRDALIFTNKRIIMINKQGATGTKMRITSINLYAIVNVSMETSGFGFDDSELTFTYISSPELKGHHVEYASQKLEFPKKFNVQGLYRLLQEMAYENCLRLNGLVEE